MAQDKIPMFIPIGMEKKFKKEECLHDYELFYGIGSPKLIPEGMVCKKCKKFVEAIEPTKL